MGTALAIVDGTNTGGANGGETDQVPKILETYKTPEGFTLSVNDIDVDAPQSGFVLVVAKAFYETNLNADQRTALTLEQVANHPKVKQLADRRWNKYRSEFKALRDAALRAEIERMKALKQSALQTLDASLDSALAAEFGTPHASVARGAKPRQTEAEETQERVKRLARVLQNLPQIVFTGMLYAVAFRGILCKVLFNLKKTGTMDKIPGEERRTIKGLHETTGELLSGVSRLLVEGWGIPRKDFEGTDPRVRAEMSQWRVVEEQLLGDGRFVSVLDYLTDPKNRKPLCPRCNTRNAHLYVVGKSFRETVENWGDAIDLMKGGREVACRKCLDEEETEDDAGEFGPGYKLLQALPPKPTCATPGCGKKVKDRNMKYCPKCGGGKKPEPAPKPKKSRKHRG